MDRFFQFTVLRTDTSDDTSEQEDLLGLGILVMAMLSIVLVTVVIILCFLRRRERQ